MDIRLYQHTSEVVSFFILYILYKYFLLNLHVFFEDIHVDIDLINSLLKHQFFSSGVVSFSLMTGDVGESE